MRRGAILLFVAPLLLAWAPGKPLLHGIASRPFPAIFGVDYPLCRAEAWLSALGMARRELPNPPRLRQLDAGGRLARDALCSLLCPVDVVTPEAANSPQIRVFLKDNVRTADFGRRLDAALADPLRLLLTMCVIRETADAAAAMRKAWPASVAKAVQEVPELETLAQRLDILWRLAHGNDKEEGASSAASLVRLAQAAPGTRASYENADAAVKILLSRMVSQPEAALLWNRLAAQAIYLRGQSLEKQGQPALAEADYSAALARLKKDAFLDNITPDILTARGALRGQRANFSGMCADYRAACALGQCRGLAAAHRHGQCQDDSP